MTHAVEDLVHELVELYDDGRTTAPLLDRVRELVEPGADPPRDDRSGGGRKRPTAPLPVALGPFHLLLDVHQGARDLESAVRRRLGWGDQPRGRGDRGTRDALQALPALLDNLPPDLPLARQVWTDLSRWHRQARTLTGHRQEWARLPRYSCPGCQAESLRQRPTDGALVCVTPSCADPEGRRYVWGLDELERVGLVVTS